MSELKPCPFCGGEAIVIDPRLRSCFETLENATMRVVCPDCGAGISFGYLNERWDKLTEEQAKEAIRATISAWNRRAQPDNEPLITCGECAKYQTPNCAAKHEQALMDFCSHGIRKPGGEHNA